VRRQLTRSPESGTVLRNAAKGTRLARSQALRTYFLFVEIRHQVAIHQMTGRVAECPVDEMNRPRGAGRAALRIPPSAVQVGVLFAGWRAELATCRKFAPAARSYAAARLMADVGLRVNEVSHLDLADVLPAIRVPTLVLNRTGDEDVPIESMRWAADRIPAPASASWTASITAGGSIRADRPGCRGVPHRALEARRRVDRARGAAAGHPSPGRRAHRRVRGPGRQAGRRRRARRRRVAAAAGPSEVLATGTAKDLVAGSGITFEDRGMRALKGLPGQWRLFAVADT